MRFRVRTLAVLSAAVVQAVVPHVPHRPHARTRIRARRVVAPAPVVTLPPVGQAASAEPLVIDRAQMAIAAGMAQIGKPYRYGSTGPDSFDCSGFTGFAWRSAGVQLPRTSTAQRQALLSVALDAMQPGDLVFSPGHVGMYIGDGQMVHSPRSGKRVEVSPLHRGAYAAGRPA